MKNLVIVGAGKIAEIASDCFSKSDDYRIVGYSVHREFCSGKEVDGLPLVPLDELVNEFPPTSHIVFVAVGYHECNRVRKRLFRELEAFGYEFASYVSPFASVCSNFELARNVLVLDFVSVQTKAVVEDGAFLFSGATVGHHSTVGAHCWVASGTTIGGASALAEMCFLGLNATIGHEVSIGSRSFVGAGALVLKNLVSGSVVIEKDSEVIRLDVDRFLQFTKMK